MKKWLALMFLIVIVLNGCTGINGRKWLSFFIDGVPAEEELRKEKERNHSSSEDIIDIVKKMKQKEEEKWQSQHVPWKQQWCNACHKDDKPMTIGPALAETCFQCHDKELFTGEKTHWPVKMGMCGFCHEPHRSKEKKLLKMADIDLCARCHMDKKDFSHFPPEKAKEMNQVGVCLTCHQPHNKEEKFLKMAEKEVCMQCHKPGPNDTPQKQAMWNFPQCVACHDDIHHLTKK